MFRQRPERNGWFFGRSRKAKAVRRKDDPRRLLVEPLEDRSLLAVTVSGTVFLDSDGDHLRGGGEAGIAGAAIDWVSAGGDGLAGTADDTLLETRTTAAAGTYSFTSPDGPGYFVRVRPPVSQAPETFVFSQPDVGGNDALDSDVTSTGLSAVFTTSQTNLDAGLIGDPATYGFAAVLKTPGYAESLSVKVAADGSTYVAGRFTGTVDFDHGPGELLLGNGTESAFVAKYSRTGAVIWARAVEGTQDSYALGVDLDLNGNVFVAGYFQGTADFDPTPGFVGKTAANGDAFVWKLDSQGSLLWVRFTDGAFYEAARGLTVDSAGSVYVVGDFNGTVDFDPSGGTTPRTATGGDAFVWKLSAQGDLVWVSTTTGGAISESAYSVAVDAAGNVYTAGYFHGTVDFDPSAAAAPLASAGDYDIFVWKLNALGNHAWAKRTGGTGYDFANAIGLDAFGGVFIAGQFSGTADFDPSAGGTDELTAVSNDAFVWTLDTDGNYLWARHTGGGGDEVAYGLAVDGVGNVTVAGLFNGTVDFDPAAIGVAARTSPAVTADAFVWKLNGQGQFRSVVQTSAAYQAVANAVAVDPQGNSYVVGSFFDAVDFDPSAGGTSILTADGNGDAFIWKLNAVPVTVSGRVFLDDNDGVREVGESAVEGAVVELRAVGTDGLPNTADDLVVASQVTAADGLYSFSAPEGGTYFVVVRPPVSQQPETFAFAPQNAGGNDALDSDFTSAGLSALFTTSQANLDAGLFGALPTSGWAAKVGGNNSDFGQAVAFAADGSTYVAGRFRGTADFDRGPGAYLLTSGNGGANDTAYLAKYSASGALVWARAAGGTGGTFANGVSVDEAGNVVVVGNFQGTADFDPGTGAVHLTANGTDVFVWKLDAAGNLLWARQTSNSTGYEDPYGVDTDAAGNVVVVGYFTGTADFDPGAGTANLTANSADGFVWKLNAVPVTVSGRVFLDDNDGVREAAEAAVEGAVVELRAVGTDGLPNTTDDLVVASQVTAADGLYSFTAPEGGTYFVVVRPPVSQAPETFAFAPQDAAGDDALDSDLSATGVSALFTTSRTNLDAGLVGALPTYGWVAGIGGGAGQAVEVAADGSTYVAGIFYGTQDFDHGPGTYTLTSGLGGLSGSAFVAKYTPAGGLEWARAVDGTGGSQAMGVSLDGAGNVVVAGFFYGLADFDPGAGTAHLTSTGSSNDAFVWKLDAAGNHLWARQTTGSTLSEIAYDLGTDDAGNIVVVGYFGGTRTSIRGPVPQI